MFHKKKIRTSYKVVKSRFAPLAGSWLGKAVSPKPSAAKTTRLRNVLLVKACLYSFDIIVSFYSLAEKTEVI